MLRISCSLQNNEMFDLAEKNWLDPTNNYCHKELYERCDRVLEVYLFP